MRETDFIAGNQDKWKRYERTLNREEPNPEELNELYVHTTDDLSYSRTFYPNRSVRVYLNGLAQRTFLQIYQGRRGEGGKFFSFWTEELPLIVHRRRRALQLSLAVFLLAMLIGVISYRIDPDFAEVIMGQSYMDMTRANIEDGDPMAVYKQTSQFDMALRITLHNIMVALLTFISGAFFAIGSVVQLIRNGVMLGTFQYFFFDQSAAAETVELPLAVDWTLSIVSRALGGGSDALGDVLSALVSIFGTGGVFRESLLTVWIHGALEISSIVIAGGAGLVMGSGLLFPGTLTRWKAFAASARDGLKIMLGTIPLFIVAGFLEGYATRHTEIPDAIRLVFILVCFAFIFWYYVALPRIVSAKLARRVVRDPARRRADDLAPVPRRELRDTGRVLVDGLRVVRRGFNTLLAGLALLTVAFCAGAFVFTSQPPAARFWYGGELLEDAGNVYAMMASFDMGRGVFYLLFVGVIFYGLFRLSFHLADGALVAEQGNVPDLRSHFRLAVASLLVAACFAFGAVSAALLALFVLPGLMVYAYAGYRYGSSPGAVFKMTYTHLSVAYGNFLLIGILALPSMFLIDSSVGGLLFAFLDWVFYADQSVLADVNVVLQTILYFFLFGVVFILWAVTYVLGFYTLDEITTAAGLRREISRVGRQKRIRGIETEAG